jgi:hypothetical protein
MCVKDTEREPYRDRDEASMLKNIKYIIDV